MAVSSKALALLFSVMPGYCTLTSPIHALASELPLQEAKLPAWGSLLPPPPVNSEGSPATHQPQ